VCPNTKNPTDFTPDTPINPKNWINWARNFLLRPFFGMKFAFVRISSNIALCFFIVFEGGSTIGQSEYGQYGVGNYGNIHGSDFLGTVLGLKGGGGTVTRFPFLTEKIGLIYLSRDGKGSTLKTVIDRDRLSRGSNPTVYIPSDYGYMQLSKTNLLDQKMTKSV